ncbi:MAG: iron-containing redox enzyme family protein [Polyangia bacterium]
MIKDALTSCVAELGAALREFPWASREAYADWLAQTYYYVRHSTRLLAASASRFPQDEEGNALHVRFIAHMAEEKKHEMLCIRDLASLGGTIDKFPELASTRMFYEPQYYKVEHQAPIALFGYILALEAMSAEHGPWVLDEVRKNHDGMSFVRLHAADDEDHLEKALATLDRAQAHHEVIVANLRQSTLGYTNLLAEIRRNASGARRLSA